MGDLELHTLSIDVVGVMNALVNYFVKFMENAEEKTKEVMKEELMRQGSGARDASDRIRKWRELVGLGIEVLYRDVARDYIESKIGIDPTDEETIRKAVLIAKGGGPSKSGPPGRIVWDEDYSWQGASTAKGERDLPASWKIEKGNDWMQNASKRLRVYFFDLLDNACASLPDSIFYDNVIVS